MEHITKFFSLFFDFFAKPIEKYFLKIIALILLLSAFFLFLPKKARIIRVFLPQLYEFIVPDYSVILQMSFFVSLGIFLISLLFSLKAKLFCLLKELRKLAYKKRLNNVIKRKLNDLKEEEKMLLRTCLCKNIRNFTIREGFKSKSTVDSLVEHKILDKIGTTNNQTSQKYIVTSFAYNYLEKNLSLLAGYTYLGANHYEPPFQEGRTKINLSVFARIKKKKLEKANTELAHFQSNLKSVNIFLESNVDEDEAGTKEYLTTLKEYIRLITAKISEVSADLNRIKTILYGNANFPMRRDYSEEIENDILSELPELYCKDPNTIPDDQYLYS